MTTISLQEKLELELKEFKLLQKQITNLANSRAQYLTQLNENEMVKKELELLENDAEVYKLIGPALIKQEKNESISNVNKRIEFINSEIKKIENTSKDLGEKSEEKRKKILELKQQLEKKF